MTDFKMVVEKQNGTATLWDQDSYLGSQTYSSGGICGPLAAKWMSARKLGQSFVAEMSQQEAREEVMQLRMNQNHEGDNFVANYLAMFGLRRAQTGYYKDNVSIGSVMANATSGYGFFFIGLLQEADDKPGHAFAVCSEANSYQFFDPNFGEARFGVAEDARKAFIDWFRLIYLHLNGPAVTEYYL
ncbi:YopT-type cysteine protease domain-containing protein [Algicella marina]|uniref:Peptidase C58 YopT-type domain-containing protein n=1 Tax=Algicella marina TaxID=2683284 RepID=A0A6P1SUP6_9RHOB|nr:YopT-type cysteine protease domain-containing protein [Algicella marina]QHQ34168.1 hypothetical protein GO499_02670 [Algicella marina]